MNNATENASDSEPAAPLGFVSRSLSAKTSRNDHLDSLLHSLELAIFSFLGILYCCDNLTFLLIIRVSSQALYTRSTLLAPTLVTNLICVGTHILSGRPEGPKALRGYLHGGLICDFVGELGPVSYFRLLLLDTTIICLQLVYLGISHELQNLKAPAKDETAPLPQDLESEEAGVRREEPSDSVIETEQDGESIEMQPMLPGSSGRAKGQNDEAVADEDVVLTLDFKSSLSGLLKRNSTEAASRGDTSAGRLATLFDRIAAARAVAARS